MARLQVRSAAMAAVFWCFGSLARAEDARCATRVTAATVVPCALRTSLAIRAERDELAASRGRLEAVSPLLPANPTLSLSGARRSGAGQQVTNWYATLAQELEIGGQRGLRRDSASAEVEAQEHRVATSRRDVARAALEAFYDAVAARETLDLVTQLSSTTQAVSVVAHAKAGQGLIAPVDADVADAAAVRITRSRLQAARQLGDAKAFLSALIGADPRAPVEVEGDLVPLPSILDRSRSGLVESFDARPEIRELDAERRAMELRAAAFRRGRVPNPTLSVFAQNDGFNERMFGVGVALPIPIPGNVGRTYNGEVTEAEALGRRASTERANRLRGLRLALTTAVQTFESRRQEVEAFTPDLLANAKTSLLALGQQVESGRLTVREAIVAQQALIELLQGHVAARHAWCLASVDLARAMGAPLDGRTP